MAKIPISEAGKILLDKLKFATWNEKVLKCESQSDRLIIHYENGKQFIFKFSIVHPRDNDDDGELESI